MSLTVFQIKCIIGQSCYLVTNSEFFLIRLIKLSFINEILVVLRLKKNISSHFTEICFMRKLCEKVNQEILFFENEFEEIVPRCLLASSPLFRVLVGRGRRISFLHLDQHPVGLHKQVIKMGDQGGGQH